MGKFVAWLSRKTFRTSKLKTLLNLTITRLSILKNQRHARCSHAQSDIAHALSIGRRDRALDRAEYAIKEQTMLDVFVMVESYCNIITERLSLLNHSEVCPDELKEAISSLIYVASRSGELPELRDVRSTFATRYGQDFVSAATEARSGCDVNPMIIRKTSTKQPSPESKLKLVRDVAIEKGIAFDLDTNVSSTETMSVMTEEKAVMKTSPPQKDSPNPSEYYWKENLSESMKNKQGFKDATSAAQAAFESAAFAAAAARAAVNLSRSETQGKGSDDHGSTTSEGRQNEKNQRSGLEKIHPAQIYSSESETEQVMTHGMKDSKAQKGKRILFDSSSSDEDDDYEEEEEEEEEMTELELSRERRAAKSRDEVRPTEEDDNLRIYGGGSSKNAEFARSTARKDSFSVRTRRAGIR